MTQPRWTLGKLKARNMRIHACCTNARCGRSYIADPAILIARFGADADLSVLQDQTCEACNAPLQLSVGFAPPEDEDLDEDAADIDDSQDDRYWD